MVDQPAPAQIPRLKLTRDQRDAMHAENEKCEEIAQREGDRLLKLGDEKGSIVALRVAAMLRIRRDQLLEPF